MKGCRTAALRLVGREQALALPPPTATHHRPRARKAPRPAPPPRIVVSRKPLLDKARRRVLPRQTETNLNTRAHKAPRPRIAISPNTPALKAPRPAPPPPIVISHNTPAPKARPPDTRQGRITASDKYPPRRDTTPPRPREETSTTTARMDKVGTPITQGLGPRLAGALDTPGRPPPGPRSEPGVVMRQRRPSTTIMAAMSPTRTTTSM